MDPVLLYIREAQIYSPELLKCVNDYNWSFDWRHIGGVTPPKSQGATGCCWCFPVVDSVETASFQATGVLRTLSVQQLLDGDRHYTDCDNPCMYHSIGCDGGQPASAFAWIADNGLQEHRTYPSPRYAGFSSIRGAPRPNPPSVWIAQISSYGMVSPCDEMELAKAVVHMPVSVSVRTDAGFDSLECTDNAIFQRHIPEKGSGRDEWHSMLIVGLGVEDGIPFWSLKNSYGITWGCDRFVRMLRNYRANEGLCGIAREGHYPIN